jgi:hypothetical protein
MPKQGQILIGYLVGGMALISRKLSDDNVKAGVQVFIIGMADMLRQAQQLSWSDFTAICQFVFEEYKLLPTIPIEEFINHVSEDVSTNDDVAKVMRFGAQSIQMYLGERDAQAPIDLLMVPEFVEQAKSSFSHIASLGSMVSTINAEKAKLIALEHLREEGRGNTTVKARDLPLPGVYGFDPDGWATFCVCADVPRGVGGDEYIAVNLTTGEVRSLGIIGD